jgi:hypothetical protein
MPKADGILVPRQSFIVWQDGRPLRFRKGRTTVRQGHTILDGREHQFRPLTVDFDVNVAPKPATSRPASRPFAQPKASPKRSAPSAKPKASPTARPAPKAAATPAEETSQPAGDKPIGLTGEG